MRTHFALLLATLSLLAPRSPAVAGALVGVDALTSTVLQEGQSSFSGVGVRARLHPERLIREIEIMPTIEYWRATSTIEPFGIRSMRKDATLGVDARYVFPLQGWQPYVGAGYAVHFLATRVNAPSLGLVEASDTVTLGSLAALGGIKVPLAGRVENFLELKYHFVAGHRQFKINWGLSYNL
ncbi:MAG: hypothetical protein A2W00_10245 [Candidatus Eisenbacteria bacterium RBG_16_71_46]|nr:MAG: hypothetical protein A2W00_10245 [Candidatus Eisenbacteria bacterium RBG_16_71_46]